MIKAMSADLADGNKEVDPICVCLVLILYNVLNQWHSFSEFCENMPGKREIGNSWQEEGHLTTENGKVYVKTMIITSNVKLKIKSED